MDIFELLVGLLLFVQQNKTKQAEKKVLVKPRMINGLSTLEDVVYKTNNYRPRP